MYFAQKLKSLREENHYLQRQIAALLDIDTPMYSRIERGERFAKEEHIPILAKY
ncbi:helix-turn-helix transcriptional regulator, partial [uncultured Duncaniella sp.]